MDLETMSNETTETAITHSIESNSSTEVTEVTTVEETTNELKQENEVVDLSLADMNRMNLAALPEQDIMKLYEIAKRVKRDPKYNPVPDIPENIYQVISESARAMNMTSKETSLLARNMMIVFGDEITLDKEIKQLTAQLSEAATMPELMDYFNESLQETYEKKMLEDAEKEEDPSKKETLQRISKAFTDSYTLRPIMELLDDETFVRKAPKLLVKKVNRMCDDYDSKLNKTLVHPVSIKITPRDLFELYPEEERWRLEMLVLAALYYTKDATVDNSYFMMYMYSFVFNIHSMVISIKETKKVTDFVTEKKKYLDSFFVKLKEVYPETPEYIQNAIDKIEAKSKH